MMNRSWQLPAAVVGTVLCLILAMPSYGQKPHRAGTTAANFLEMGFGCAGSAMGDAYVAVANDLSACYWNPAGLAYMPRSEAQFTHQPWLLDIRSSFAGVGLVLPRLGTFALSLYHTGYGEMEVTTVASQEGTGETFSATDFAFAFSYSRQLAQWFAFGASAKYVSSQIWHVSSYAVATDLGVQLQTHFFSPTGARSEGMSIGMSISNFGTKMRYDGMDLLQPIDILPLEQGNYRDVRGQFRLEAWELPLLFRIGVAVHPLVHEHHRLTLAIDALHPNNNSESVNVGAQYQWLVPTTGTFFLRAGYKALFMEDSEYGLAFGAGATLYLMHNTALKLEYAYRGLGILGKVHAYTVGVLF